MANNSLWDHTSVKLPEPPETQFAGLKCKTDSVATIFYPLHSLTWLINLKLPLNDNLDFCSQFLPRVEK